MKKLVLFIFCLYSIANYAQVKENNKSSDSKKYLVSVHYVGNLRNNNFISNGYNGLIGLDAKYIFAEAEKIKFQAGLNIDFLTGRKKENSFTHLDYKNTIIWNPNIGLEGNLFNSNLKPFFNIGFSFFTVKEVIPISSLLNANPSDPAFSNSNNEMKFNESGLTINPGLRYYFKKLIYLQTDYKYLPLHKNLNTHFINIGLGCNF